MSYVVLARRWRPKTFEEVVGQEHITRTLTKAIESDRIAHAYLFTGPRGIGKTTTARILAKALNCHKGISPTPCNKCPSCKEVSEGNSIDVLEIDGASNRGIDEIRALRANVKFAPARDRFKIYIIDEVHMLTPEAFNALLKTLEEPPEHVKFIFATTGPHKLPATIISRCQRFAFRRISVEEVVKRLKEIVRAEKVKTTDDAVMAIAREASGSMRDAESILDQLISFSGGEIKEEDVNTVLGLVDQETFLTLSRAVSDTDTVSALKVIQRIMNEGKDTEQFIRSWQKNWRDILMAKMEATELIELPESTVKELKKQAEHFSVEELFKIIGILTETVDLVRKSISARIPLEIAVAQMTRIKGGNPGPALHPSSDDGAGGPAVTRKPGPEKPAPAENGSGDDPGGSSASFLSQEPGGLRKEPGSSAPDAGQVAAYSTATKTCELTLHEVREKWPVVLENIKKEKLTTSAFLMEGRPIDISEGKMAVAFNEDASFHRDSCNQSRDKKLIETVLEKVFRTKFKLHCVDDPTPRKKEEKHVESQEEGRKKELREKVSKEPIIKKAMEIFDVGIVEINEEANS